MGATRIPIVNPSNDPGRNQPRKKNPTCDEASRGGHIDAESMMENPGGAATTYCKWSTEADEQADRNAPYPRDRGHRAV